MSAIPHRQPTDARPPQSMTDDRPVSGSEQRLEPRLKLPVMYTLVRVRLEGEAHYRWTGHIYDISLSGMRFEIDEAITPGTKIEIRAMLPGHRHTLFRAAGHIVRVHEDDPAVVPVRLAMAFDEFASTIDRYRLSTYLAEAGIHRHRAATPRRPAA